MKMYRLERRQSLPISIEAAWDFFSQPLNLPLITPPWLDFSVISEVPDRIYAGMIISFRLRPLLGLPVTWVSEITHVREPRFFVDEQKVGPYRFWHHEHFFTQTKDSVQVHDIVHYDPGYGVLGRFLNKNMLGERLAGIFEYRKNTLTRLFDHNDPG